MTTRVGLQIPAGLPFERWQQAGAHIARVFTTSAWCLGDWLVFGQTRYSDRYRQAVETLGLDYQTLRNYAWVTRAFELSRRREQLSFQHHAEVAALPPADQDEWLDRAVAGGWSKSRLRLQIRAGRNGGGISSRTTSLLPQVSVPTERVQQWRAAAERTCRNFDEWVLETLDRAAMTVLTDDGPGH